MNKLVLFFVGIIAGIILFSNLGAIIGLMISAAIVFAGIHYYRKSASTLLQLFWGGVLVIGLITAVSNIPAFIGIVAAIAVYYVWKSWNKEKNNDIIEHQPSNDPFVNFEKQWDELKNNNS